MNFEAENTATLDHSVPIIVRSNNDEYIFQFALNKKEIKRLQRELKVALKVINMEGEQK